MKFASLLTAVAATALMGGAAFAQPPAKSSPPVATTAQSAQTGTAVSTSVTTTDPSGATVTNTMVTNGPVPDTPENRAKYGQPLSHAGRRTLAKGN